MQEFATDSMAGNSFFSSSSLVRISVYAMFYEYFIVGLFFFVSLRDMQIRSGERLWSCEFVSPVASCDSREPVPSI